MGVNFMIKSLLSFIVKMFIVSATIFGFSQFVAMLSSESTILHSIFIILTCIFVNTYLVRFDKYLNRRSSVKIAVLNVSKKKIPLQSA